MPAQFRPGDGKVACTLERQRLFECRYLSSKGNHKGQKNYYDYQCYYYCCSSLL